MKNEENSNTKDAGIVEAKNPALKDDAASNVNNNTEMPDMKPPADVSKTDKAKAEEPLPNTAGPPSSTKVTNTPVARKPALSTGPFRYDQGGAQLVVGRSRLIRIPLRFLPLFNKLFAKDGVANCRCGYVSYFDMGMLHREGWIEENLPDCPQATKDNRLAEHRAMVEANQKYYAQACVRDLRRWLRRKGIDPDRILRCDRKAQTYFLGDGWAPRKPLINAPLGYLVHRKDLDRESQRNNSNTENGYESDPKGTEDGTEEDEDDSINGDTRDEEPGEETD